jgi:8-oxo-dGTP diphosphatase
VAFFKNSDKSYTMFAAVKNPLGRNSMLFSRRFFSGSILKQSKPIIGVNVLLIKNNKLLLGTRLNAIHAGTWGAPGGHLEAGETPTTCAIREVKEETDLDLVNVELLTCITGLFKEIDTPYQSYFVLGTPKDGEPKVIEPHKCESWQWFDLDNLPTPLFDPIQKGLDQHGGIENLLNLSSQIKLLNRQCP